MNYALALHFAEKKNKNQTNLNNPPRHINYNTIMVKSKYQINSKNSSTINSTNNIIHKMSKGVEYDDVATEDIDLENGIESTQPILEGECVVCMNYGILDVFCNTCNECQMCSKCYQTYYLENLHHNCMICSTGRWEVTYTEKNRNMVESVYEINRKKMEDREKISDANNSISPIRTDPPQLHDKPCVYAISCCVFFIILYFGFIFYVSL